jgi:hypothetical protein
MSLPESVPEAEDGFSILRTGDTMRTVSAIACVALLASPAFAKKNQESETVTVGPWKIATTYNGDKFENCVMRRTSANVDISFVQTRDGLSLLLHSQKWKLDRGKVYSVRLSAGRRSLDAKALAEMRGVTITLTGSAFNKELAIANRLNVHGASATVRVPLNGSAAALRRLDQCFNKNGRESADTNPFAPPVRKP